MRSVGRWDVYAERAQRSEATGWPEMIHSDGRGDCVHWLSTTYHSSQYRLVPSVSQTWLVMLPADVKGC